MAPGALQIIIIILLVMVLFGAGRIPTIMENLAKGINSFKKGLKDEDDSSTDTTNSTSSSSPSSKSNNSDKSADKSADK